MVFTGSFHSLALPDAAATRGHPNDWIRLADLRCSREAIVDSQVCWKFLEGRVAWADVSLVIDLPDLSVTRTVGAIAKAEI
jgi:hypothetical protein